MILFLNLYYFTLLIINWNSKVKSGTLARIAARRIMAAYAAGVLGALSVLLFAWQVSAFRRAGTPIPTTQPTRVLVLTGPYRYSRNPVYLAMTVLYVSLALAFGGAATLLLLAPLLLVVRYGVIAREERYLERKFGDDYRAYKSHVRRWI